MPKKHRADQTADGETQDQRQTRTFQYGSQNAGRGLREIPLQALVQMGIVAEPLHNLLVLHLIDQRVRGLLVRRIKNKDRIVADAAISRRRRLAFRFQLSNPRPNSLIVVDRKLWSSEFYD